jgi:hypothetical protein
MQALSVDTPCVSVAGTRCTRWPATRSAAARRRPHPVALQWGRRCAATASAAQFDGGFAERVTVARVALGKAGVHAQKQVVTNEQRRFSFARADLGKRTPGRGVLGISISCRGLIDLCDIGWLRPFFLDHLLHVGVALAVEQQVARHPQITSRLVSIAQPTTPISRMLARQAAKAVHVADHIPLADSSASSSMQAQQLAVGFVCFHVRLEKGGEGKTHKNAEPALRHAEGRWPAKTLGRPLCVPGSSA